MKKRERCKDGSLNMNFKHNKGLEKFGQYPDYYNPKDIESNSRPSQSAKAKENKQDNSLLEKLL